MAWYTITLNNNGGSGTSPTTAYYNSSGYYWATAKNTGTSYRLYSITTPTRANYVFNGFWTGSNNNGTQVIGSNGSTWGMVTNPFSSTSQTVYAGWLPYATITLNKGEYGTGGTSSFYYKLNGGGFYSNTSLTTAITSITPPTGGGTFTGYTLNGVTYIDRNGNFTAALLNATITQNYTLTASWLGGAIDYFNLASSALVPIASNSGEEYTRVTVAHKGKYERSTSTNDDPVAVSRIRRNPSTTYAVVKDTTISVKLGKAWAATKTAGYDLYGNWTNIMTVSGYMITTVEIRTEVGKFPTVTVSAVANEGADAVNNFTENQNKFNVYVPVVARSKAQNLLNAITGGGHLQRMTITATCDPVVIDEQLMPCASDIVNGRYDLTAETIAINGEAAPTMSSRTTSGSLINGGFTLTDVPKEGKDADYIRYTLQARREMS